MQKSAKALELLVQHTLRTAEAGEIGARELANMAYGGARGGGGEPLGMLFRALAIGAER